MGIFTWAYPNRDTEVKYEIKEIMNKNKTLPKNWTPSFLKKREIRYILLENNDTPSPELLSFTKRVFKNDTIKILEVLQSNL